MNPKTPFAFSLLEVCLVLMILTACVSLALGPTQTLRHESQMHLVAARLQQALQTARTLAMLEKATVTICGSASLKQCDGEWSKGVRIIAPSGQQVLAWPKQAVEVQFSGFKTLPSIAFDALGQVDNHGQFRLQPAAKMAAGASTKVAMILVLSPTGRVRQALIHAE